MNYHSLSDNKTPKVNAKLSIQRLPIELSHKNFTVSAVDLEDKLEMKNSFEVAIELSTFQAKYFNSCKIAVKQSFNLQQLS